MSDSDSDELQTRNVFTYQNESTMVSATGPGGNFSNTAASFRSSKMSSIRMPQILERPKYPQSSYGQYNLHQRDTSPLSLRSVCDARQRRFNYSFNPHGMSSSRSVYNGRAGSPMSVRSIDSTASVSAVDIANALKHEHFSKEEMRVIRQAYNKFVRHRVRKRICKRSYRKVYREAGRARIGGEDSGEQGSDSSVSSDDRSIRTAPYKDSMSSSRSAITDISTFRRKIQNSEMFRDHTESLKHGFSQRANGVVNLNNTQMSSFGSKLMPVFKKPANFHNMQSKPGAVMLQKERFTNGFLLPSQRFNKTASSTSTQENVVKEVCNINKQNEIPPVMTKNIDTDSDCDNIFSNGQKQSDNTQRKRNIADDDDDFFLPKQKRLKSLSPCKNSTEAQKLKAKTDDNAEDFIFAKPTFPVRKPVKEKLISKSAAPSLDTLVEVPINQPGNLKLTQVPHNIEEEKEKEREDELPNATQNSTNLSMRPSFIKRKLFTQKLVDVSEKRNLSTDSLNSPQNSMYGAIQKERKARKLQQVTTQSCLNRDLQKDDNNLLNLIQKIVPIDQMNVTSQTNKTDRQSKNSTEENTGRWDASDIISSPKRDSDVSDTFTDEEILNLTVKELQNLEAAKKNNNSIEKEKVAKQNGLLKDKFTKEKPLKDNKKSIIEKGKHLDNAPKETVLKTKEKLMKDHQQVVVIDNVFKKPSPIKNNCRIVLEKLSPSLNVQPIRQFWDTDFESDIECTPLLKHKSSKENLSSRTKDNQQKDTQKKEGLFSVFNLRKPINNSNATFQSFAFDNTQKFNASTLRIKSHRDPKRPKFDRTNEQNTFMTIREPEFRKQKLYSPPKQIAEESKKQLKEITNKKDKSPNAKKQTAKDHSTKSAKISQNNKNTSMKTNRKVINDENTTQKVVTNNKVKDSPVKGNKNYKVKKTSEKQNKNNKIKKTPQKDNKVKEISEKNNRKLNENDERHKKQTKAIKHKKDVTKSPITKKPKLNISDKIITRSNSTLTEENNNNRPVRSCRLNNSTISNDALDTTANKTLRSRKINLTIVDANETKNMKKIDNRKETKTRISDVSFSLSNDKNAATKKPVKKLRNLTLFNADESDVSFSLKDISLTPRITRSNTSNNYKNNLTKSIFLRNNTPVKDFFVLQNRSLRQRIPNKRFLS